MHTATERRTAATSYTPGNARDAILADALGCIISGRPLPDALRTPTAVDAARPSCVEDGIRRIMMGGATA